MENMEFKGTKGKWLVSPIIRYKVLGLGMKTICELPTYENKNLEANAKLISKAPEMLEMLEKVLDVIAPEFPDDEQYNLIVSIKQLIKEATTI